MITKRVLFFTAVFSALFFIAGCGCGSCAEDNAKRNIPDKVAESADKFVISKTGKKFFEKNIYPDAEKTRKVPAGYYLSYTLTMEDKDYVNDDITFLMDSTGKVLEQYDIKGIPNCKDEPEECAFKMNRDEAVAAAREHNLPEGIKDWAVEFRWSAELGRYIWHVLSTTEEASGHNMYRAEGEEIMIDPGTGEVLKRREWELS